MVITHVLLTYANLQTAWDADDNIFAAHIHPLYDNEEDLLYRHNLKGLLQSQPVGSKNSSTISVSPLKQNVYLTAKGENVERAMENPRALVQTETQHEVALKIEKTGVLEEPSEHQCDGQFATCPFLLRKHCLYRPI